MYSRKRPQLDPISLLNTKHHTSFAVGLAAGVDTGEGDYHYHFSPEATVKLRRVPVLMDALPTVCSESWDTFLKPCLDPLSAMLPWASSIRRSSPLPRPLVTWPPRAGTRRGFSQLAACRVRPRMPTEGVPIPGTQLVDLPDGPWGASLGRILTLTGPSSCNTGSVSRTHPGPSTPPALTQSPPGTHQ